MPVVKGKKYPYTAAGKKAAAKAKKTKKQINMKGVKHYLKNGTEYKGAIHKTNGKAMTGAKHTASSKPLVHKSGLAKPKAKKAKK